MVCGCFVYTIGFFDTLETVCTVFCGEEIEFCKDTCADTGLVPGVNGLVEPPPPPEVGPDDAGHPFPLDCVELPEVSDAVTTTGTK